MKNLLVWTYPLVPDPRAVWSPMPLYIAAGGRAGEETPAGVGDGGTLARFLVGLGPRAGVLARASDPQFELGETMGGLIFWWWARDWSRYGGARTSVSGWIDIHNLFFLRNRVELIY